LHNLLLLLLLCRPPYSSLFGITKKLSFNEAMCIWQFLSLEINC
jgi:hypothetical protein